MFVMFILFDDFSSEPPAPQRGAKEDVLRCYSVDPKDPNRVD